MMFVGDYGLEKVIVWKKNRKFMKNRILSGFYHILLAGDPRKTCFSKNFIFMVFLPIDINGVKFWGDWVYVAFLTAFERWAYFKFL